MKKVFESSHVQIFDLSEEIPDTIFANWTGYFSFDDNISKDACLATINYFKEYGTKIMISDHKNVEGVSVGFMGWLDDEYYKLSFEAGLKAEFLLKSDHEMGNEFLELMYDEDEFSAEVFVKHVESLEQAKQYAQEIIEKVAT